VHFDQEGDTGFRIAQSDNFIDDLRGALNVELKWESIGLFSICVNDKVISPSLEHEGATSGRVLNEEIARAIRLIFVLPIPKISSQLKALAIVKRGVSKWGSMEECRSFEAL
jgi:hypothetical protein